MKCHRTYRPHGFNKLSSSWWSPSNNSRSIDCIVHADCSMWNQDWQQFEHLWICIDWVGEKLHMQTGFKMLHHWLKVINSLWIFGFTNNFLFIIRCRYYQGTVDWVTVRHPLCETRRLKMHKTAYQLCIKFIKCLCSLLSVNPFECLIESYLLNRYLRQGLYPSLKIFWS